MATRYNLQSTKAGKAVANNLDRLAEQLGSFDDARFSNDDLLLLKDKLYAAQKSVCSLLLHIDDVKEAK